MAESSLDSLRKTREVAVEWRAYELHPENMPPVPPDVEAVYRKRIADGWPRVVEIARERFGLDLQRMDEPRSRPTRLAHVGAKYAIAQGLGEAYHRAVFRAHWQQLRDISSAEVLSEIAGEVGLGREAFRAALDDERYLTEVETDEYWAYQQNLSGVPAFIFGNHYLVSGAQPPEMLAQVVDKCLEEGRVE